MARGDEMNREDIIAMAREAGAKFDPHWGIAYNVGTATFERFAQLVAAKERTECAKVCELTGDCSCDDHIKCAGAIRARGVK